MAFSEQQRTEDVDRYTVEFLTPMTGAAVRRSGRAAVTSNIQEGITAQRLRYLDLLLDSPWRVSLLSGPMAAGVTEAHTVIRAEMAGLGLDVPSAQMVHAGVGLILKHFLTYGRRAEPASTGPLYSRG